MVLIHFMFLLLHLLSCLFVRDSSVGVKLPQYGFFACISQPPCLINTVVHLSLQLSPVSVCSIHLNEDDLAGPLLCPLLRRVRVISLVDCLSELLQTHMNVILLSLGLALACINFKLKLASLELLKCL